METNNFEYLHENVGMILKLSRNNINLKTMVTSHKRISQNLYDEVVTVNVLKLPVDSENNRDAPCILVTREGYEDGLDPKGMNRIYAPDHVLGIQYSARSVIWKHTREVLQDRKRLTQNECNRRSASSAY